VGQPWQEPAGLVLLCWTMEEDTAKSAGPQEETGRTFSARAWFGDPPRQPADDWILRRAGLYRPNTVNRVQDPAQVSPATSLADGEVPALQGPPAATAAPLSTAHIRPQPTAEKYFVGVNGQVVVMNKGRQSVVEEGDKEQIPQVKGGGIRKEIKGFSPASRLRFMRTMGQWNALVFDLRLVLGVTLTYPMEFPCARASKRHLKMLMQRIERSYPGTFGVWKLEPQKRGAPHFHIVLAFGVSVRQRDDACGDVAGGFEESFQHWLADAWYEIVGSGDVKHQLFHKFG